MTTQVLAEYYFICETSVSGPTPEVRPISLIMYRDGSDTICPRCICSGFSICSWDLGFGCLDLGLGTSFGDEKSPFPWIFLIGIRGRLVVS